VADLSTDYGRSTRIVVSGYDRARVHSCNLVRGERRVLVVSIKGATVAARKIVTARWQCDDGTTVVMSSPQISADGRETAINVLASWTGSCTLKCTMTLDNGEALVQLAVARVGDGYLFTEGTSPTGPTDISVSA
jgi:hypothetical protein